MDKMLVVGQKTEPRGKGVAMVFLIMLLHGVPVYVAGIWSGKVRIMTIVAIISGFIAVVTGNPYYMINDLVAVGCGWGLGFYSIRNLQQ